MEDSTKIKRVPVGEASGAHSRSQLRGGQPTVSVIVPAYNAASTMAECLGALLDLRYPDGKREIIVVDNNSTDHTAEIIKRFPVTYLLEDEVQSSYAARNRGVAAANGEILAFTDSDCLPDPLWLERGVEGFADDLVGAVAGRILGAAPQTVVEEFLHASNYLGEEICLRHPFLPYSQTANAFYRRTVFERIGLFNPAMVSGGDADLAWRMQMGTHFKMQHNPLAVVLHKHRATARGFFRQMQTHGRGKADLQRLYRQAMQEKNVTVEGDRPALFVYAMVVATLAYHLGRGLALLLAMRPQKALFELIAWYGKTGKRLGFLAGMRQTVYGPANPLLRGERKGRG